MRLTIGTLTCAIALFCAAPQAHAAVQATMQADSTMSTAVLSRINSDTELKTHDLKVSVKAGVATLSGTVHNEAEKTRAAELAKAAGATKVENMITVGETRGTAGTIEDKTVAAAKATGAEITDAWITTSIKTDFVGEDALKNSNINVDTNRHVVTLKGTVASQAGRERAVDIVKHTNGVDRIVDTLTIAPK